MFDQVVWQAARRFQPDIIMASVGFDAHWADPLAGTNLSLMGYDHLSRELIKMASELCGGKVVFVMEGGYNLNALGYGWANIARALIGDTNVVDPMGLAKSERSASDVQPIIDQVKLIHSL